jgi:hypothetical protein
VTKVIGATGGALTSGDGKVTITIPAGAFAGNTTVSIQPISNNAPGGLDGAYRITPDGTQLSAAATLTFNVSDADLRGTTFDVLGIASQDANRHWRKSATNSNATTHTLTVTTSHFSDWSLVYGLQLRPLRATVVVGKSVSLSIQLCDVVDVGDIASLLADCDDDPVPALPPTTPLDWQANGIPTGNASVGTVLPAGTDAIYTAPAQKPANNPVAVSVNFGGQSGASQLLVSNIKVVDEMWVGRSTTVIGSITARASVIFIPDEEETETYDDPNHMAYSAEGFVDITGTIDETDDFGNIIGVCTISAHAILPSELDVTGALQRFKGANRDTYYGIGNVHLNQCHFGSFPWLHMDENGTVVGAGGTVLEGNSSPADGVSFTYKFTRP